jgi:hypothetical protein
MRLSIYDHFMVGVAKPNGGWSKGAAPFLLSGDECAPPDLLIPNDLDNERPARYVTENFLRVCSAWKTSGGFCG